MLQHQSQVEATALAHIGSVTLSMATRTSLTGGGDRRDGRSLFNGATLPRLAAETEGAETNQAVRAFCRTRPK